MMLPTQAHRSQWPENKRIQMCLHFRCHSSHQHWRRTTTDEFRANASFYNNVKLKETVTWAFRLKCTIYVALTWNQFNPNPIGFWPLLVKKNTCLITFMISAIFFLLSLRALLARKEIVLTIDWELVSSKNLQLVYFRSLFLCVFDWRRLLSDILIACNSIWMDLLFDPSKTVNIRACFYPLKIHVKLLMRIGF